MNNGKGFFESHYVEIMTYLRDNPNSKREDVYSHLTGSRGTRKDRVDELIELELVTQEQRSVNNVKILNLTLKGQTALQYAEKLNSILNNEIPEPENNYGAPKESISVMKKT